MKIEDMVEETGKEDNQDEEDGNNTNEVEDEKCIIIII